MTTSSQSSNSNTISTQTDDGVYIVRNNSMSSLSDTSNSSFITISESYSPLLNSYTIKKTPVVVKNYPIVIDPPLVNLFVPKNINIDTGLNSSWLVQKQACKYLQLRVLDYWIHKKIMRSILKFLKMNDEKKIVLVKNKKEYEDNDISSDTASVREKKADFIEYNYLDIDNMKKILIKVMDETNWKWVNLSQPKEEKIVVKFVKHYLKKQFRKQIDN